MFRFILIIFSFLFFIITSVGQTIAVENLKQRTVYPHIEMPLNIVVENTPCQQILVQTDNGTINRKSDCHWIFKATNVGAAQLTILTINDNDTVKIDERKYYVKRWPTPKAKIGRISEGIMRLAEFKAQLGITVPIQNFDICGYYKVKGFDMLIIRNGSQVFKIENNGGRFEEKTRTIINKADVNDQIIFENIQVITPGSNEETTLAPISIKLF